MQKTAGSNAGMNVSNMIMNSRGASLSTRQKEVVIPASATAKNKVSFVLLLAANFSM